MLPDFAGESNIGGLTDDALIQLHAIVSLKHGRYQTPFSSECITISAHVFPYVDQSLIVKSRLNAHVMTHMSFHRGNIPANKAS